MFKSKNRFNPYVVSAAILSFVVITSLSARAQTWDLAADFSGASNPNGAWTYGWFNANPWAPGDTFTAFPAETIAYFGPTWYNPVIGPDITVNTTGSQAFGIAPGDADIAVGTLTPDARWTAPSSGLFDITADIGGSGGGEGGYGDVNASDSGLNINGVSQSGAYDASTNINSWTINDVSLSQGSIVDLYVNGTDIGGNTQAVFTITEQQQSPSGTPEPSAFVAFGIGALVFARKRFSRRRVAK